MRHIGVFATVAALIMLSCNPFASEKTADISVWFDADGEILHGGYAELHYRGKTWRDDFGRGFIVSFEFYSIKLKDDRNARIEVNLQNAFGVLYGSGSEAEGEEPSLWLVLNLFTLH